ncbi:unnamed protein product [Rotaria socialis]|uniref:Uncharacterized protein n=1 Tax=Rotaria socialis TaxID=392032 RepID=A0A821KYU3_9BILA|nr:unnamed protein product [Rotaria socialis]
MPVKSHQRIQTQTDTGRMRDRANTMTTVTSKKTASTSKRLFISGGGGAQHIPTSGTTRLSSGMTSLTVGMNPLRTSNSRGTKIITEVDDTNIDEVLKLSDVSLIPASFLTEIQQDEVYETILEELRKKMPNLVAPKTPSVHEDEQQKPFSPHVLAINDDNDTSNEDDDDDDVSIDDGVSSSQSSDNNPRSSHEDYDTDIETDSGGQKDHDPTGRQLYRELCKEGSLIPCSYFLAHIQDSEMILRYHQFNTEDIKAITKTLVTNLSIDHLYLDGNFLQEQATKYITQLILTNDSITELSLADNRLGGNEGTKEICRMLTLNRNLKKLNLSGNKFNELDITQLIEAFEQNKILHELDLSHNSFGEACGKVLGTFISSNDSLESIDLSWNNFRGRSAIDLVNGIKENVRLKRCNLAMNGLGPDSGQILADCIKQNSALEELNLIGNRLNTPNAFAIAQALSSNDSLEILKLDKNQINSDGVLAIFLCIKANDTNSLRVVDFAHTVVTEETVLACEDIVKLKNGQFKYLIGSITPKKLQPNSTSECYVKTNEELLNKLRSTAANKILTHEESIATNMNDDQTASLEVLRYSVNELQRKQIDIHRHIGQLSSVMSDFEYYMEQVRQVCESSNDDNNELCQSLISHLESVINDTRSVLVTSSNSTNDAQQVHDLVDRLYEENQRIANHIDDLIQQDQFDTQLQNEQGEEDHIQKAIEHIELAFEENTREQEYINKEQEHFENNQKTIESFIQTTEQLHEEALGTLREHIKVLREQNQSLKYYNEQIDILTKQLPLTSLLHS